MTAFVIAIEGGDGVGKNTISRNLAKALRSKNRSVAVIDFPRYQDTLAGGALTRFLNGNSPHPVTPKVAAVLYALDRLEFKDELDKAILSNEFVIFDRYVASNVAYQAAKVPHTDRSELMEWIAKLELETFELPVPNLNILLKLDVAAARELVQKKPTREYTELTHDLHEADDDLQQRLRENYDELAGRHMISRWLTIEVSASGVLREPTEICSEVESFIQNLGVLT